MAKQADRVLALLRARPAGLNTVDLTSYPTADGGPPILRLAARVFDLQQQGHRIRSERKMNGTSTYFLEGSVEPGGAGLGRAKAGAGGGVPDPSPPDAAGHDEAEGNRDVLFVDPPKSAVLHDWDGEEAA